MLWGEHGRLVVKKDKSKLKRDISALPLISPIVYFDTHERSPGHFLVHRSSTVWGNMIPGKHFSHVSIRCHIRSFRELLRRDRRLYLFPTPLRCPIWSKDFTRACFFSFTLMGETLWLVCCPVYILLAHTLRFLCCYLRDLKYIQPGTELFLLLRQYFLWRTIWNKLGWGRHEPFMWLRKMNTKRYMERWNVVHYNLIMDGGSGIRLQVGNMSERKNIN